MYVEVYIFKYFPSYYFQKEWFAIPLVDDLLIRYVAIFVASVQNNFGWAVLISIPFAL